MFTFKLFTRCFWCKRIRLTWFTQRRYIAWNMYTGEDLYEPFCDADCYHSYQVEQGALFDAFGIY